VSDDRAAIIELVLTYAERIDAGDLDGVADLLAHARVTAEGFDAVHEGRDAVLALYRSTTRLHDDGTPRTKHLTTNLLVRVDTVASTATCRSYFTVLQAVPGALELAPIIAGRYHDAFERAGGSWRFTSRHMLVDLVGDVSQHLHLEL
jgi:hypothetical protein